MNKLVIISVVALFAGIFIVSETSHTKNYINQSASTDSSLTNILNQIKAQNAAKQQTVATTNSTIYNFTRILKLGSSGNDVKQLQILLNKDTATKVALSGAGSPGKESTYYGPATAKAVSKFQLKYKSEILTPNRLTNPTGTVGSATLKKLNSIQVAAVKKPTTVVVTTLPTTPDTTTPTTPVSVDTTTNTTPVVTNPVTTQPTTPVVVTPPVVTPPATTNTGTTQTPPVITQSSPGTLLPAGTGFAGATAQPAKIGTGFGSDASAIAHWDTVPFQTFTGTMNVSVVAFHGNDIDHVAFSANGGAWINIYSMTLNPETNVVEYWATLRASDFSDGQVEVRAIAYPKIGVPKVLQGITVMNETSSLLAFANSGNTLAHKVRYVSKTGSDSNDCKTQSTACLTITKAMDVATDITKLATNIGADIYLGEGSWKLPGLSSFVGSKRWLTFMSAPGTNPDNVQITGMDDGYGVGVELLHLKNLSLVGYIMSSPTLYQGLHPQVWIDTVYAHLLDPNALCDSQGAIPITGWGSASGRWDQTYYTDVHMYNTGWGPTGAAIARNVYAERTAGGHGSGTATLINYSVKYIDGGNFTYPSGCKSGDIHGDIYQLDYHRTNDDIVYGFKIIPGGWIRSTRGVASGWSSKDVAIVNYDTTGMGGWTFSAGGCRLESTLPGQQMVVSMDNWVVKNSYFGAGDWCGENPAFKIDNSLFTNIFFINTIFDNGNADKLPHPIDIPGIKYVNAGTGVNTAVDSNNIPTSYTIVASAGSNGTISPSGTNTYINTGSQTYTITANPNYQVDNVLVDGISKGAVTSYTFPSVTTNHTISATFKAFQSVANVPTSGLVGYWPLNDNTGTSAVDASGNGNTGTLAAGASWTTGKFGPGIHLDGSGGFFGSYISLGKTGQNGLPSGLPVSISAWANYPVGGSGIILGAVDYGNGGYDYELKGNSFCAAGSNGNGCVNINAPSSGWHHIVGIGTDAQLTMYVDGVATNSTAFNVYGGHGGATNVNVSIGADWNGAPQTASGDVDDVRIYNRALSSDEVQQLYTATLAARSSQSFTASVVDSVVNFFTQLFRIK